MGNILIDDVEKERDSWIDIRKSRIGSSEIGAVLGLSKYKTRLDLYLEKTGQLEQQPDSIRLKMGRLKEPLIAELFTEETGLKTWRAGHAVERKGSPWAIATPDYYYQDHDGMTGVLELKNVDSYSAKDWEDGNVPDYAYCQCMWQMGITGHHRGIVCALIGDRMIVTKEIPWDAAMFEDMLRSAKVFMDMIANQMPPEPTAQDLQTIQQRFNPDETKSIELPEQMQPIVKAWLDAKKEIKRLDALTKVAQADLDQARASILMKMGDASFAVCGAAQIEAKKISKPEYKVKARTETRFNIKVEDSFEDFQ